MSELDQAIAMFQSGRLKEAERLCRAAVKREPKRADAWQVFGIVHYQRGNPKDAVTCFRRAVELKPDYVEAHNNLGLALVETGRLDDAAESFRRAIALKPDYVEAHNNLGIALKDMGRAQEAVESYRRALALKADAAQSHFNLGIALLSLSRFEEAAASLKRATALDPADAEAHGNLGAALAAMRRPEEAAASHRRAIALQPDHADAHYNLGNALSNMGALDQAVASYQRAIELAPQEIKARHNLGTTLIELRRYNDAIGGYDKLLAASPRDAQALGPLAFCHAALCDFERAAQATDNVRKEIAKGGFVEPFIALALGLSGAEQSACARRFVESRILPGVVTLPAAPVQSPEKIRIAYLSADFRNHPVANAIAELIECHDHSRFEIIGVSFGPDDKSAMRARLGKAFDQFLDLARADDSMIAQRMRELGIHIAVDLGGHTRNARPGVFAQRSAPVQASWLGYAGTTGIEAIDYILADQTALPFERQPLYGEKIVHLPDSFFVNDSRRQIASATPARGEAGLPKGFVFCCFNQSYKFTKPVVDVWMRLLGAVEGSVLWLSSQHDGAAANLRREAKAHGIDPERIVFAQKVASPEEHLARLRLADLFLDTLPYNAHATACDALFAGLPVLTCTGEDFPGRVAASMLQAVGLPELVTADLVAYEKMARKLASEPATLAAMRARLNERGELALFDTDRFRRNIEAAYIAMWERHLANR